jgi:Transposase, Mutator family
MSMLRRSAPGRRRAATRTRSCTPRSRKVRDGGRVVAKALVVAHGVHETGRREILSIDVGEAETAAFWTDFLRGLVGIEQHDEWLVGRGYLSAESNKRDPRAPSGLSRQRPHRGAERRTLTPRPGT